MVVALHLVVEHLALLVGGSGHELVRDDLQDLVADVHELLLDGLLVVADQLQLVGLALGLDGREDAPRRPARANDVLVGHGQEVALLDGQLDRLARHSLHVCLHLIEALGLRRIAPFSFVYAGSQMQKLGYRNKIKLIRAQGFGALPKLKRSGGLLFLGRVKEKCTELRRNLRPSVPQPYARRFKKNT